MHNIIKRRILRLEMHPAEWYARDQFEHRPILEQQSGGTINPTYAKITKRLVSAVLEVHHIFQLFFE